MRRLSERLIHLGYLNNKRLITYVFGSHNSGGKTDLSQSVWGSPRANLISWLLITMGLDQVNLMKAESAANWLLVLFNTTSLTVLQCIV